MSHRSFMTLHASSSRPLMRPTTRYIASMRQLSFIPDRTPTSVPYFTSPLAHLRGPARRREPQITEGEKGQNSGKGKPTGEEEVDDREWEMRVAKGMLHLRETLPLFFDPSSTSATLFPPEIFSQNVVLKLPPPLPIRISSLPAYSMAFSITRNGMQALHSDLRSSLDRMTISPVPSPSSAPSLSPAASTLFSRRPIPTHRQKQIRVLLSIRGSPRLPPHKEATWHTSSLYTFSPYTGLISSHEVEVIRPLPGEGVAEWLMSHLLGWTSRQGQVHGGGGPVPAPVPFRGVVRAEGGRSGGEGGEGR